MSSRGRNGLPVSRVRCLMRWYRTCALSFARPVLPSPASESSAVEPDAIDGARGEPECAREGGGREDGEPTLGAP